MPERIVIIGASLTGGTAAVTLREEGFDGSVVLIGEEQRPPYERPPLSKEYLRGQQPFEKSLVKPLEWYAEHGIETRFGETATSIDPERREVVLGGGDRVPYDAALIATGGRNRQLPVPGAALDGVLHLRTVEDAERIRGEMASGRSAVVVGMGFIGAEVAASLRTEGIEVTAIEPFATPLYRVLGADVGRAIAAAHADQGVRLMFEDSVESFEGSSHLEAVRTKKGTRIDCDFAVVGVGITPATDVAKGAGIEIKDGILVDELCRTSIEGVYAAGDVANHAHPLFGRRMRVEHWQNAMRHGAAAARNMLGKEQSYAEVHWFWSDQYETNIQYAGYHTEWDQLVVRGSIDERSFVGFYVKGGVVDAAVALNRGKDLRRAMALIKARTPVSPEKLRDEDEDLRKLAGP